jgi:hypothetical protein
MTVDQLVRESCAAQDVPLHVDDPEVLARIAALMRPGDHLVATFAEKEAAAG